MSTPNNINAQTNLISPPPAVLHTLISFPAPHILLATLNRPEKLNAIPRPQHFALERLWEWFDDEPGLRVAVIMGSGRAFCAGADLKEWDGINDDTGDQDQQRVAMVEMKEGCGGISNSRMPRGGFGGMSNRPGKKPILAAVDGICFGGGMEMAINCDMVIASSSSTFGLPEVTIGVIALAGALPRLVKSVGRQRAAEMALGGKAYTAEEMRGWGLVNEVVQVGKNGKKEEEGKVLDAAMRWAKRIAGNSPDAVIVSREGLKLGWEGVAPDVATEILTKGWYGRMDKGENMVEGVKSFVERRKPVWRDSKL
ncbi:enoyl-hydratase [Pseudomassariella vexata]|uniref:Enoyl-hydratase n=1 Tax=Pseudomassariella vexata TaxID=1141098 RepID=A0A1Y2DZV9_9PEZI|nr:enoyl-hydratase [Pseudomassariella vexata]ORY64811.1 enoyl-hydratase [Pseudomassariella vexata]